jgi:hypothetical protein
VKPAPTTLAARAAAPKLAALPRTDGLPGWRVHCCHCRRDHLHGSLGHKTAHCFRPESPYRQTGYVLTPPQPKE